MENFAETPNGVLLIANGFGPVLRWDGFTTEAELAGVAAPEEAVELASEGVGPIAGDYTAYLRYVDRNGNLSDLSPISDELAISTLSGEISDATDESPIVITTIGSHGLTTGDSVFIQGVAGNAAANGQWVITVLSTTTFSLQGSEGDGTYIGGGTWARGAARIVYSNIEAPASPQVARRQILRNTAGQADIYYVDLDTTDLTSTTLSTTKTDSQLSAEDPQPILNADGSLAANSHGVPPNQKAAIAHQLDRMFYAGETEYKDGHIEVTFGSKTVQGVGTEWVAAAQGRFLWVSGAVRPYEIASVNVDSQSLTLAEPYGGATDAFAAYSIRPGVAEKQLVYYSEAGLPESVPATNAFALREDGDEIVGLMARGSFLFILKKRNVYRFTFESNPAVDGGVFHAINRGCVNNRCWVITEDMAYLMDEGGVYSFGGDQGIESVSLQIKDIFRHGDTKINWAASRYFHALHDPAEKTIRWFVALAGAYLPRHAIVYDYAMQRWSINEFPIPITASCRGVLNGVPTSIVASLGKVYALSPGLQATDGAEPGSGTMRGTATSATWDSLTDTTASFASSGMGLTPVTIVDGRGAGQTRVVASATSTTLRFTQPWAIIPDSTSVYQVGGIKWSWKTGWHKLVATDANTVRSFSVDYETEEGAAEFRLSTFFDNSTSAEVAKANYSLYSGAGVRRLSGEDSKLIDLTKLHGFVKVQFDGRREVNSDGKRQVMFRLSGTTNTESTQVNEVVIEGVRG